MKALVNGQLVDVSDPTAEQIAAAQQAINNRPPKPAKPISGTEFLSRLTAGEYAAILNAAHNQLSANQPMLSIWIDTLRLRGNIVVTDQSAIEAKAFLIAQNLLTQERADLIFAKG